MKTKLQLAILLALSSLSVKTNAQIYYYDISPDEVINTWNFLSVCINTSQPATGSSSDLQIWNDAGSDINVRAQSSDCEVLINGAQPAALSLNQSIGSTGTWAVPTGSSYNELNNGSVGNWVGITDGYLGVRIKSGSNWLYGWIRMDINTAGTSATIKDYACNTVANASINAGQTVTGIDNFLGVNKNFTSVYPNPITTSAIMVFDPQITVKNAELIIYDLLGNTVKTISNINKTQVQIERDNLPGGIYLYQLRDENKIVGDGKIVVR